MANDANTNYFKIGMFILTGIFLIIVAIVSLASKSLWQKTIVMETYFTESVQGLSIGSPVKYLGMDIGEVTDIATVDNIYYDQKIVSSENNNKFIYIKMSISPRFFNADHVANLDQEIKSQLAKGLRIKLALQGLTGNAYLELAYVNPDEHPPLSVSWQPKDYYIPSFPSTLTYFSENASYILRELRKIDFQQVFNSFQELMQTYEQTGISANKLLETGNLHAEDFLTNLAATARNARQITEQAKQNPSSIIFGQPPQKLDLNKL